ncbi:hypothetical protein NM208_g16045 [Fusarium decemcellulare]|uniref:Uncharacterized protein n=1 Tax=Fusarium decemcellulare TaxID=57161 RepID=A0ACC1RCJ7_9HYPO|nr:hypothetical protein NM208_g16045 [Fusarium decemcellulare]
MPGPSQTRGMDCPYLSTDDVSAPSADASMVDKLPQLCFWRCCPVCVDYVAETRTLSRVPSRLVSIEVPSRVVPQRRQPIPTNAGWNCATMARETPFMTLCNLTPQTDSPVSHPGHGRGFCGFRSVVRQSLDLWHPPSAVYPTEVRARNGSQGPQISFLAQWLSTMALALSASQQISGCRIPVWTNQWPRSRLCIGLSQSQLIMHVMMSTSLHSPSGLCVLISDYPPPLSCASLFTLDFHNQSN